MPSAQRGVDALVTLLPPITFVIPVHDAFGNHGFVPVDESRERLSERVLCLLVADYLTRTEDFLEATESLVPSPRRARAGSFEHDRQ